MKGIILVLLISVSLITKAQETNFELKEINFKGNKTLSSKDLKSVIISRESPGKFWQFLYKISERLGDKPSYIEKIKISSDIVNLQNYYQDNGFFDVKIDTSVVYDHTKKTASLTFIINEGQPYKIENVEIFGLNSIPDSVREIALNLKFLKPGNRFRRIDVEAEIQRILNLLYDNGYPDAYVDRTRVRVLIDSTRKVTSISIPFYPNARFVIKNIKILFEDTTRLKVSENIVRREVEFKTGEFYNRSLILKTETNISQTGLFENVRINIDRINQTDSLSQCDVIISLVPFNKHDISPAIYFSDERNAFNVGVSLDYRNRNFLGGGRHFASSVRFQIQSLNLKKIPNIADTTSVGLVESDLRLEQPYLLGRKMPGQLGLSMTLDKQKRYVLNIVRNRLRFAYRAIDYSAYLDWDIESVNIKFQSQVDSTLAKLYPRQINSILSLTFQLDKVDDLLYPRSGYSYLVSVEEGGLFPFLFAQAGFKVQPFSQYYKLTFFYRRFFSLNNSVFGFKFKLGFANEYFLKSTKEFELSSIPINRRFFAGGSASVRGWRIRELGMVSNPSLGGKILIEANFENRTIVWRNLGFVLFLDAGNLWDEPRDVKLKYLAVAGGFGVRYLTFFGGLRFDFGFKVYDPGAEKKLIFNKTGLQILKDMIFHIGVGQTF